MKTILFKVTLLDDVIISASSATEGQHESLDYLPGSLFLGAIAQQIYDEITPQEAWTLFHSGEFKFHDALPVINQKISYPMPFCYHELKGEGYKKEDNKDKIDADKIYNLAVDKAPEGRQPKQLRSAYLTEQGDVYQPKTDYRMMTAIDAKKASAAEGQLFGYDALVAGQTYYFSLNAPKTHQDLTEKVKTHLTGYLKLGRSRTAHYGRVQVEYLDEVQSEKLLPLVDKTHSKTALTLWLLSDLALVDEKGNPTLEPKPTYLGLSNLNLPKESKWIADKSFIRTRRYSPFNAYRKSYDQERYVIARGSVLHFELSQPLSESESAALTQLGRYQELGLGQIAVNPTLLSTLHPNWQSESEVRFKVLFIEEPELETQPISALLDLIAESNGHVAMELKVEHVVNQVIDELKDVILSARHFYGILDHAIFESVPNKTQWGNLKSKANDYRNQPDQLWTALFNEKDGMIRNRSGWEIAINPTQKLYQKMEALLQRINPTKDDKDKEYSDISFPLFIGHLAVKMQQNEWSLPDFVKKENKND